MSEQIELPEVSEDDVLAGKKTIALLLRDGTRREVVVRALPWREALQATAALGNGDVGNATILITSLALEAEYRRDSFLDKVVPDELVKLSQVALQITNGVEAVKKLLARKNPRLPGSATSSPSSAS